MATSTAMAEDTSFEEDQLASMTTDDIIGASRLLTNESRILKVTLSLLLGTTRFPHSKFIDYHNMIRVFKF